MTRRLAATSRRWAVLGFFGLALCAPATTAGEACHRALLASFDRSVDASACAFLRLEDGRFAGIASQSGVFFRSNAGEDTTYTWMNTQDRVISIASNSQTPWTWLIQGLQTFPDPKSYYFPFVADPGAPRPFCPDPKNFSPLGEASCD